MLGIANAHHAEYQPPEDAALLVTPSVCAVPDRPHGAPRLWGRLPVRVAPESRAFAILRRPLIDEEFFCSYELNPRFQARVDHAGLRVSGIGEHGEARIVEIPEHPFFLATSFLPQLSSEDGQPHPLIVAFLAAARRVRLAKGSTLLR